MSIGLSLVAAEQCLAPLDHEDCLPPHIWMNLTVVPRHNYLPVKLKHKQTGTIGIIAINIVPNMFQRYNNREYYKSRQRLSKTDKKIQLSFLKGVLDYWSKLSF